MSELVSRRSYAEISFLVSGVASTIIKVSPSSWQAAWGISSKKAGTTSDQAVDVVKSLLVTNEKSPEWAEKAKSQITCDEAAAVLIASTVSVLKPSMDPIFRPVVDGFKNPERIYT